MKKKLKSSTKYEQHGQQQNEQQQHQKKKKISNIVEIIKMKIKIISLNKTKIKKIKCKIWK